MGNRLPPIVGNWYAHRDKGALFQVVALDEDAGTIEIQEFDGGLDELDIDEWRTLLGGQRRAARRLGRAARRRRARRIRLHGHGWRRDSRRLPPKTPPRPGSRSSKTTTSTSRFTDGRPTWEATNHWLPGARLRSRAACRWFTRSSSSAPRTRSCGTAKAGATSTSRAASPCSTRAIAIAACWKPCVPSSTRSPTPASRSRPMSPTSRSAKS